MPSKVIWLDLEAQLQANLLTLHNPARGEANKLIIVCPPKLEKPRMRRWDQRALPQMTIDAVIMSSRRIILLFVQHSVFQFSLLICG
jgi:hypothetical protein